MALSARGPGCVSILSVNLVIIGGLREYVDMLARYTYRISAWQSKAIRQTQNRVLLWLLDQRHGIGGAVVDHGAVEHREMKDECGI